MSQRKLFIAIILGVALLLIGFIVLPKAFSRSHRIACTQEAKLCPDGSYVGRAGPTCEFTACPNNDLWKTMTDTKQGIAYQYPDRLLTKYISAQAWPPVVKLEHRSPSPCPKDAQTLDGRYSYCLQTQTEGAAGSVYTTYTYSTGSLAPETTLTISFTLRAIQCNNYDNPQRAECLGERETFDIDGLVDRMAHSVELLK